MINQSSLARNPEEASFTKKEFTIQEPLKPIVPETLEEWMAKVIMKETFRRIDKKAKKREKKRLEALRQEVAGEGKSMGDIEDLLKQSKETFRRIDKKAKKRE